MCAGRGLGRRLSNEVGQILLTGWVDKSRSGRVSGLKEAGVGRLGVSVG